MEEIKIIICGFGKMSKVIIKYLDELKGNIVAVFDHNNKVGLNVNKYCNTINYDIYVKDIKDLETILIGQKPDICIVATKKFTKRYL